MRILLADDHHIFRAGLRAVLATASDFVVVGEAARGDEALQLALSLKPEIAVVDIERNHLTQREE